MFEQIPQRTDEAPPFERHTGDWEGVVMIERPDLKKLPYGAVPMCRVMSARTVQLQGRRAICETLAYAPFAQYFNSSDGDHIFCEAEYKADGHGGGHLEVYGRARTNLKEWVIHSMTEQQAGQKMDTSYQ